MDFKQYIESLEPDIAKVSAIDDIETWNSEVKDLSPKDKKYVFEFAERRWLKRKIEDGTLLFHPDIHKELLTRLENNKGPLKKHRQMVYANLLASYEKDDSKEYFERMKAKIIKKYNSLWFKGVYDKLKPTYAAHRRLKDLNSGIVGKFTAQSMFMGSMVTEDARAILRRLPTE